MKHLFGRKLDEEICPFCRQDFDEHGYCARCGAYVPDGQSIPRDRYPELFKFLKQGGVIGLENE